MAVTGETLRRWAAGAPSDAEEAEDDLDGAAEDEFGEEGEEGEEEMEGERNRLWAGELGEDETEISDEEAEELLAWLEDNEPEIFDSIVQVADATMAGDEEGVAMATESLQAAEQNLNPEYPPMSESEKNEASSNIAKHMADKGHPEKDSPEWKQAVAIGIAEARRKGGSEGGGGEGHGEE